MTTTDQLHGAGLPEALVTRLCGLATAGPDAAATTVIAPWTGQVLAEVPTATPEDVAAAVARARAAQPAWAARSLKDRAAVLLRLHDLFLARRTEGLDIMQWETGKARRDAVEEILDVAHAARYAARLGPSLLKPRRRRTVAPGVLSVTVHPQPKGVVGLISPWNYPLVLIVNDIAPALMAGNAVVIKPDHQTPLTALWAASLLHEAGVPVDVASVVVGDGPTVGGAVIDTVDYVAFTGSHQVGRLVAERAGRRLIGCSLELGGKNAMIVCADADVAKTARGAVTASFANAGQLCQSMERIYVVDSIYDEFRAAFLREVDRVTLGPGLDFRNDVGSLISTEHRDKVVHHVSDAVAHGATVVRGGEPRPDLGPAFYAPTVLEGVTEDMVVCRTETFGPVVALYRVPDEESAIRAADDSDFGLNASIWTRDVRRGQRIGARLHAGTVHINDGYAGIWAMVDAPLGGMRASGLGRRNGSEGMLRYVEPQSVVTQRLVQLNGPGGERYEQWYGLLTTYVQALRKLGVR